MSIKDHDRQTLVASSFLIGGLIVIAMTIFALKVTDQLTNGEFISYCCLIVLGVGLCSVGVLMFRSNRTSDLDIQ